MALTHELDDAKSPVRKYLVERFPIIAATKRGQPNAAQFQTVLGLSDAPTKPVLEPLVPIPMRGDVGTALDYRVRYYLGTYSIDSTVAADGAQILLRYLPGKNAARLADQFFRVHEEMVRRLSPVKRRLSARDEELLARHCVVLAYYEQLFRAGVMIRSPLYNLTAKATVDDLLALPPEPCIRDVYQLSLAFETEFRPYFSLAATLNPRFDGSDAIGGADADFMLGNTLYDVKSSAKIERGDVRDAIYQLLGYTLLDYRDSHGIREVALYLARYRMVWKAPLWVFLLPQEEVPVLRGEGREPETHRIDILLKAARAEFAEIVEKLSHA